MQFVRARMRDVTGVDMSFLIKSAFWLTIVFSCMEWPGGERPGEIARQTAGVLATRAQTAVLEKSTEACANAPFECLGAAQRAAALSQKATPSRGAERARSMN